MDTVLGLGGGGGVPGLIPSADKNFIFHDMHPR